MVRKAIRDIEKGMVFDHIRPGYGTKISDVLKGRLWSEGIRCPVYTAEGVDSSAMGEKDFVKLDGLHLEPGSDILSEIAIIQPDITVNWIDGGERADKKAAKVCIGNEIRTDLIDCANTNCIANDEAPGIYNVMDRGPLRVRCHYCGRVFEAKYNRR